MSLTVTHIWWEGIVARNCFSPSLKSTVEVSDELPSSKSINLHGAIKRRARLPSGFVLIDVTIFIRIAFSGWALGSRVCKMRSTGGERKRLRPWIFAPQMITRYLVGGESDFLKIGVVGLRHVSLGLGT